MTRKNPVKPILEQQKKESEVRSLTLYVVFSIAVLIIYTIVEQVLSVVTSISHDTLTTCIYAAFGGEILACALIKIFKLREGGRTDELDN